jgi:hypothetical protein
MKCEICGTELRAELAITEPGWIIFHECIIRGDTEQEVIDNYEKIRVSAHNSDYTKCTNEVFKYVTDNICDEGITKKVIKTILKKHFA